MPDEQPLVEDQAPPRQELLQAALDLIDQGFTLIDQNLKMVAWNRTFLRLLDFPDRLAYMGAPFEDFMRYNALRGEYGPGDPETLVQERVQAARDFAPHTMERTRPDGTVLRVRGVPVPGHGFVTLYSDITIERRAEQQIQQHAAMLETRVAERTAELRRNEGQMRLITDSIPALVAYFDRDRTYRYVNRGYQDWFGLDPEHPERVSAREFLGDATYASIRHHVARALSGESVTFEYEARTQDGRTVVARTTLIPEVEPGGRVAGCFELTFDITEQKRSQAMLAQAQKMEALGQLTGGLAHDFNNMLTVIVGNLGGLKEWMGDDEAVTEFVEPALAAARRGTELIRALMSFARRQPLHAASTDIGTLSRSMVKLLRRSLPEHLRLEIRMDGEDLFAWVDPSQMQDALVNLVLNARDARAGLVVVAAHAESLNAQEADRLHVTPGRFVRLDIADDGHGMDSATRARVFEPFFTTKRHGTGTGLGMSMVYGFARQSDGAIDVASEPGRGTTVSLWLPRSEPPTADGEADRDGSPEPRLADQALALLVEDDPEVRRVVRRQLIELGFAVVEAENGVEALQMIDQIPRLELLLSDLVMPGGVDGRAVVRHAQARAVPHVALMSGYDPDADGHAATDLPILAKPFTRQQLANFLRRGHGH